MLVGYKAIDWVSFLSVTINQKNPFNLGFYPEKLFSHI
jgi:hypothetical protein